jgi:hypothetical protein
MPFDDEPKTKPDGLRTACPGCPGPDGKPLGYVEYETWGSDGAGYSKIKQTCSICWGTCWIGRDGLERWRARSGG